MKKYVVEFIGSFFLIITICMTVQGGLGDLAPLAIGAVLMVMVFAGGHISGAHYNPAVTLSVYLRGKLALRDILPYMSAQVLGAVAAAFISTYLLRGAEVVIQEPLVFESMPALVAELLGTFALCYVILHVATAKGTENNSFYGLAIGFTVCAMAYTFGSISGGAFNPGVAVGISLAGIADWSNIWIYLLGNFIAGGIAALVFNYVNGPE